jgi:phosphoribosylaminoimidazolecarboxamide formyltransferase/IMP cyclohydrolase
MGYKITRALLSVTDKAGLMEFATGLAEMDVTLVSTGGTAKALRTGGLTVIDLIEITGFPEMLDGRVKTLHPSVHGGILARRDDPSHRAQLVEHHIALIDLACVNLYSFEATVAKPSCTFAEAIENIDIGGPCLIRASAKNHNDVTVVTDQADYPTILAEMRSSGGEVSPATRLRLAAKAFRLTNRYDGAIADYMEKHSNYRC